jgi:hypothetical protein
MLLKYGLTYTLIDFYKQANHIQGPQTNFTVSPRPFDRYGTGSLLSILKNILELEYGPIGIKSSGSEAVGSNEDRKEI